MNELVNLVVQQTGLPTDKAQLAVQTVIGYLKDKLPAPIAGQLDNFVGGGVAGAAPDNMSGGAGSVGDIMKDVGGMFGNK